MTWLSRLTKTASNAARALAGLALLGAGCARSPVAPRPAAVYVSAESLAVSHPQWAGVAALDRQIAWLGAYRPRAVTGSQAVNVDVATPLGAAPAVDIAVLQARINRTLADVQTRERAALLRRLRRTRAEARASDVLAERAELERWADAELQRVFDETGKDLANLSARLAAIKTQDRIYQAMEARQPGRGWEEKRLTRERAETEQAIEAAMTRRVNGVDAVFRELEQRFAVKERAEAAATLKWLQEHRNDLETLDQAILDQKRLLSEALRDVGGPVLDDGGAGASGALSPVAAAAGAPALPSPALLRQVEALRARRNALARFVVQNTAAIVKSSAGRRANGAMTPVFQPATGVPDRTEAFRAAVRDPAHVPADTT